MERRKIDRKLELGVKPKLKLRHSEMGSILSGNLTAMPHICPMEPTRAQELAAAYFFHLEIRIMGTCCGLTGKATS